MYDPKPNFGVDPNQSNSLSNDQLLESSINPMNLKNGGSSSTNPNLLSRQRLRWTNELHERFVDAVTQLGGSDSNRHGESNLLVFILSGTKVEMKDVGDLISGLESTS
ncbi:hypothetical protein BHE74_00019093 [Ensete ventricosum]|nr:hypothetical protein BHE74_00019093 [Ensete ventricosum]